MFDIVAIGDAFLDHIVYIKDGYFELTKNRVCFTPGGKTVVESFEDHIGGNAPIAASAMKKLGLDMALITYLGQDEAGEKLLKIIKERGIDISQIYQAGQTNRSAILQTGEERTIFSLHAKRDYPIPKLPETHWLYLSSVAKEGETIFPEIYKQCQEKRIKIIFAPGSAQIAASAPKFALLLRQTAVLCLNDNEAKRFTKSQSEYPKDLLKALQKLGPQIIVMTAGEKGAYGAQGQSYYFAEALKVNVADATGAGDSFAGAFAAAIILGNNVDEALKWGTVNSAANIVVRGGQEGLLDRAQIKEKVKNIKVEQI